MSEPVARLIEHRQDRPGAVHELAAGVHVLGRLAGADVILEHADVSRRHAELEITDAGATIRDLGSKNGVVVGGRKVAAAALDDGARINLGELGLVLEHPGARVDRLLARGQEPTIRRPRSTVAAAAAERSSLLAPSLLPPILAALVFAALLTLLLVFG